MSELSLSGYVLPKAPAAARLPPAPVERLLHRTLGLEHRLHALAGTAACAALGDASRVWATVFPNPGAQAVQLASGPGPWVAAACASPALLAKAARAAGLAFPTTAFAPGTLNHLNAPVPIDALLRHACANDSPWVLRFVAPGAVASRAGSLLATAAAHNSARCMRHLEDVCRTRLEQRSAHGIRSIAQPLLALGRVDIMERLCGAARGLHGFLASSIVDCAARVYLEHGASRPCGPTRTPLPLLPTPEAVRWAVRGLEASRDPLPPALHGRLAILAGGATAPWARALNLEDLCVLRGFVWTFAARRRWDVLELLAPRDDIEGDGPGANGLPSLPTLCRALVQKFPAHLAQREMPTEAIAPALALLVRRWPPAVAAAAAPHGPARAMAPLAADASPRQLLEYAAQPQDYAAHATPAPLLPLLRRRTAVLYRALRDLGMPALSSEAVAALAAAGALDPEDVVRTEISRPGAAKGTLVCVVARELHCRCCAEPLEPRTGRLLALAEALLAGPGTLGGAEAAEAWRSAVGSAWGPHHLRNVDGMLALLSALARHLRGVGDDDMRAPLRAIALEAGRDAGTAAAGARIEAFLRALPRKRPRAEDCGPPQPPSPRPSGSVRQLVWAGEPEAMPATQPPATRARFAAPATCGSEALPH